MKTKKKCIIQEHIYSWSKIRTGLNKQKIEKFILPYCIISMFRNWIPRREYSACSPCTEMWTGSRLSGGRLHAPWWSSTRQHSPQLPGTTWTTIFSKGRRLLFRLAGTKKNFLRNNAFEKLANWNNWNFKQYFKTSLFSYFLLKNIDFLKKSYCQKILILRKNS